MEDEIRALQDSIARKAKEIPVPERFIVENLDNGVIVIDTITGRYAEVPLYAYGPVRYLLTRLFG